MSFGSRLKERREELKLKQSELGKKLGITGAAIGNYENGVSSPKADILYKVFDVLKCDANYLFQDEITEFETNDFTVPEIKLIKKYRVLDLHGKEAVDSVLNIEYKRFYNHSQKDNTEGIDNITYLKYFDFAVSAGTGEPLGEGSPSQRMAFPTEIVPENAHYCLRVNGHSMEPAYEDGDIVFVQRMDTFVREGEIGIFVFNGEGYIKQLGHQELISLNPEYPPLPIGPFDRCDCQGRVLGKV